MKKLFLWSRTRSRTKPLLDKVVNIKGERIVIREKRPEDIPDEYAWRIDEELSRLDATRPLNMSYEDFYRYSKEDISFPSAISKRLAVDTDDGRHIGNIMYYDLDRRKGEAELGIMIGEKRYWSQGYGTEIVGVILAYLFKEIRLNRVYLHTLSWNFRAQRCFAKAGFREVKTVRRSGQDFILMESLRESWEARYSQAREVVEE